jgi:hypothetical protein
MNRSDFDISLKAGQEREQAFESIMRADSATIEVKDEHLSKSHVFIEHRGYGKPSGIAITKATHWAIEVYPNWWVVIPTEDLRSLHDEALAKFGERHGGDQDAAFGAIVPKPWLVNMA